MQPEWWLHAQQVRLPGLPRLATYEPVPTVTLWARLATALLVATASCGAQETVEGPTQNVDSGDAVTLTDTPTGPGIEVVCTSIGAATCAPLGACCDVQKLRYDNSDACREAITSGCLAGSGQRIAALQAGLISVDASALSTCTAAIEAAGAQCRAVAPGTFAAVCAAVFRDPASVDGVCAAGIAGIACADGSGRCRWTEKTLSCSAPGLANEDCSGGRLCAAGLRCVAEPGGAAQRCRPPGEADAPCATDDDCVAGHGCLGASDAEPGVCAVMAADKGPCTDAACPSGQACVEGTCRARVGPGEGCATSVECLDGSTCAGALQGRCEVRGKEGDVCTHHLSCAASLACDPQSLRCVAAGADGQPCVAGSCIEGWGCDATDDRCRPLPGDGAACLASATPCGPGLRCEAGTCAAAKNKGDACEHPVECAAGLACDQVGKQCVAHLAAGETCGEGIPCAAGLACTADAFGALRCVTSPTIGQACTFGCADGLYCQTAFAKGVCQRTLCLLHAD